MCFGGSSPEVDDRPYRLQQDQAEEARIREDARQARVKTGQSILDAVFEGGSTLMPDAYAEAVNLNPDGKPGTADWQIRYDGMSDPSGEERTFEGVQPYLADRRSTLLDYYQPDLEQKHDEASDQLKYGLARAGQTLSSEGAESRAELANKFDARQTEMLSKVDADEARTRNRFSQARGRLEDMLLSTGDAARVANRSLTTMRRMQEEQPEISPLGDIFANAVATYNAYGKGRTKGRVAGVYDQPSITSRVSPSGTLIN
jgi:hypothetical protein